MITLLVIWTLRSLALACVVGGGLRLAGVRNPYVRKTAWTAVLAAILVMPLLMQLRTLAIQAPIRVRAAQLVSPGQVTHHPALPLLGIIYLVGVLLFASHYAAALLRMARIRTRANQVSGAWTQRLDVRRSATLGTPATFGRTILLPRDFERWSADQRAAVIAHERAHVLGFDCHRLWLARLYVCLCWFNPLSWWLARRLGTLAEETSDAAAVQVLGDGPRYAEMLLAFASRAAAPSTVAAMARSDLPARIERIIGAKTLSVPPRRSRSLLMVAGLVPVVAFCALLQPRPARQVSAANVPTRGSADHTDLSVHGSTANSRVIRTAYPPAATRAGITGWAYVRVTVDPQGRATRAWLVKVVPAHVGFGPAALRVARSLRYDNPSGRTLVETLPVKFALSVPRNAPPKTL